MNDLAVSTPAFQQALYIQQHAEAPVSRTGSVELLAQILSRSPKAQSAQSALLDDKIRQQQVKCTAIQALLQLSPLLAEEASSGQAASAVLIQVLLPVGDVISPRHPDQLNAAEAELRRLCLLALASLSVQPQSMASLFALAPPPGSGSSGVAVHPSQPSNPPEHALWPWLDDLFLTGWQHKQVRQGLIT